MPGRKHRCKVHSQGFQAVVEVVVLHLDEQQTTSNKPDEYM